VNRIVLSQMIGTQCEKAVVLKPGIIMEQSFATAALARFYAVLQERIMVCGLCTVHSVWPAVLKLIDRRHCKSAFKFSVRVERGSPNTRPAGHQVVLCGTLTHV
jgi:hypothetical protein